MNFETNSNRAAVARRARPVHHGLGLALSLFGALLAEGTARADTNVWGGEEVTGCGWPTSVAVVSGGALCTGTVVHERVVTYAAHCGAGNKTIVFGNSSGSPVKVATTSCYTNPDYNGNSDQKHDWAFCVLAQTLTGFPVTPLMYGCEIDHYYKLGQQVAIAGFGNSSDNGGAGTKRWAYTEVTGIFDGYFSIGVGDLPSICSGDSGGPVFVQYEDGSWHNFGIVSTGGGGCMGAGQISFAPNAVPWIEQTSGIDITPCHDADGTWNPGPSCTNFAITGVDTPGDWGSGCTGIPGSGPSGTCGQALGEADDTEPPTVMIVTPADGEVLDAPASPVLELDASDVGWGLDHAWVTINGTALPDLPADPYVYDNLVLPEGAYTIVAHAIDFAGNEAAPDEIKLYVGVDPPPDASGTDGGSTGDDSSAGVTTEDDPSAGVGTESGADSSAGEATGGTESGGADEEGGCGCRAAGGESRLTWLMVLALALPLRRRARR